MLTAQKSTQVEATVTTNTMTALPTVKELTAQNSTYYLNVKECDGKFGCKHSLYSQLCTVCTPAVDTGCVVKSADFTYPTLATTVEKATTASDANGDDGNSKDDVMIYIGIADGMIAVVLTVLVAFRHERRRVREPKLKLELLIPNTRANGLQVVEITTCLEKPVVPVAVVASAPSAN